MGLGSLSAQGKCTNLRPEVPDELFHTRGQVQARAHSKSSSPSHCPGWISYHTHPAVPQKEE